MADLFISYSSSDRQVAEALAKSLLDGGHTVFRDTDPDHGSVVGEHWRHRLFRELRRADAVIFVNSEASQASQWCHTELAVALEASKRIYPLAVAPGVPPHPLLGQIQSGVIESDLDAAAGRLHEQLRRDGLSQKWRPKWHPDRPPYPGLAAFEPEDAGVFFGRDLELRSLVDRVDPTLPRADGDMVFVLGPSGAGKSSLVRAGLMPILSRPGSGWLVLPVLEPGLRPVQRLVGLLAACEPGSRREEVHARARSIGLGRLGAEILDARQRGERRLLVCVDQMEQLLTLRALDERDEFLGAIASAVVDGSPVTVVVTARSDRLDEMQALPNLGGFLVNPVLVPPLGQAHLGEVIEGPAERADLTIEAGLTSRILDDATRGDRENPVRALPLVAFALRGMYERMRSEGRAELRSGDYEAIGGLDGAIAQRTASLEAGMSDDAERSLETLLARLVTVTEDRSPLAVALARDALQPDEEPLVRRLEDERILTGDAASVRLTHDLLLRAWPRLARVIERDRDDLATRARLERQAADWERGTGETLTRDAARDAAAWLDRTALSIPTSPTAKRFVDASTRRHRRTRAVATTALAVIVGLAAVAIVFAIVATRQADTLDRRAATERARRVAAAAEELAPTDPELAVLLAREASRITSVPEARRALILAIESDPGDSVTLSGHSDPVFAVAYSPDGTTLATASSDDSVRLWDVGSAQPVRTLEGHTDDVMAVAFAPDGRTLASASRDGTARMWDVASGSSERTLTGHGDDVYGVAFSPDGEVLATAGFDDTVRLWDVSSGRPTEVLAGHTDDVVDVAFSPDGATLATASSDRTVRLWDVASGRDRVLAGHTDIVFGVAFSPDGSTLATASVDQTVRLWDVASGTAVRTLVGHTATVFDVAFSPDGDAVATAGGEGAVRIWERLSGAATRVLTLGTGAVYDVDFSPRDGTVAAAVADTTARLWQPSATPIRVLAGHRDDVLGVAYAPRGDTLATGSEDDSARLWNLADGTSQVLTGHRDVVYGVAFSPDGAVLATTSFDRTVRLWQAATGTTIAVLEGHRDVVWGVAFSPDGTTLATASSDGTVRMWDVESSSTVNVLTGHTGGVHGVVFSPDGSQLVTAGFDGAARLWNVTSGSMTRTFAGHTGVLNGVALSPDGAMLATAGQDRAVRLWDVTTGTTRRILTGHTAAVRSVAFSPDGATLASASDDGTVRLWDVATGDMVHTLTGHTEAVSTVAFAPDGATLAAAGADETVRISPCLACLDPGELAERASALVSRELTADERRLYLD